MKKSDVFSTLLSFLEKEIETFPDPRSGTNKQYEMRDIALGAFSVFFMNSSSFLDNQKYLQTTQGKNNAQSLFGIETIPSPNWIRTVLDRVEPEALFPAYNSCFQLLAETKVLDQFRFLNDNLLIALDGTDFFFSNTISCQNCFNREHKNGTVDHLHKALTPAIVMPGSPLVIPLPQEHIKPQDGHKKQDCENAAAKRWLSAYVKNYLTYGKVTILGDDLYSRQPICEEVLKQDCNFIFVCKPSSHKYLYDWVKQGDPIEDLNEFTIKQGARKKIEHHTYRFMLDVPLHGEKNPLRVNYVELTIKSKSGDESTFSFITNLEVDRDNVSEIVKAGRTRWKIENEHNNVLKNQGYHLDHNFGHGEENLSNFFLSLNILAFLFHTILSIFDVRYILLRETLGARRTFFNDINSLTRYMYFSSWQELLKFMIRGLELEDPGG